MKAKRYDMNPSTPLIMACPDFNGRDYVLASIVIGSPKVAAHVAALGRQAYCFNGEYRQWVWEKFRWTDAATRQLIWRAWVSNAQGISFEVRKGASPEEARAAWDDYKLAMGVTEEKLAAKRAEYGVKGDDHV